LTINGGTVDVKAANRNLLNAIRVNGDFAINSSANFTMNGPVDLGGGVRSMSVTANKNCAFGASLTNGAIVKTGPGILTLSGSSTVSNRFTQGVVVQQGTLGISMGSTQDGINALGDRPQNFPSLGSPSRDSP